MANPNTADIRQYLTGAYSDGEITVLCADYFRDVADNFATGMTKGQKIQLLLDHCQRRELIPNLLAALQKDRPEQYRKQFGQVAMEAGPAPARRERDPRQVFISHAHEDAEFAHRLAADLQTHGWRTWIAPESIRPGEKWAEAVNRGLEECGVFVVALSPAAIGSEWVKTETNIAIELAHRHELRFIPLEVVSCRAPVLWDAYQRIPFAGRYPDGLKALLTELDGGGAQSPGTPTLTITSPIHRELVRPPGGLQVDSDSGEVWVNGAQVPTLTNLEYRLLLLLYARLGKICTKYEVVEAVWGEDYIDEVDDARIETLIRRLRQKIEPDVANPRYLITVRGRGYKLVEG